MQPPSLIEWDVDNNILHQTFDYFNLRHEMHRKMTAQKLLETDSDHLSKLYMWQNSGKDAGFQQKK